MDSPSPVTHLEWCAGYGGIHLGLRRVIPGLRLIAASEIEAYGCALLVSHMEAGQLDPAPVWTDLKTFPCGEFRGLVDIFSAGFPCQPFSCAGARAADEDPRHLWPYILQGVIAIQPRVVLLENVEGIVSAKLGGDGWTDPAGTPVLLHVLRELEWVGYRCEAGIFSAAEVGASHRRKRVIILAVADSEGCDGSLLLQSWRPLEASAEFRGGGEAVADAGCGAGAGRRITGDVAGAAGDAEGDGAERERMRDAAGDGGADMANPESIGRGERRPESGGEQGRCDVAERGGSVGHAYLARPQGRCMCGGRCADERALGQAGLPSFPPGPGELDRWGAILAEYPELAPAIESPLRGVADGTPDRVDRLRLCGNGVVPATVACAFTVLARRLAAAGATPVDGQLNCK